ncbi:acyl-protein synthetase [Coriobacteriia bacterium Es71-Z0120]|uniref:LuxE/PaaK family acyltransferase n=1 Tax=Parvivirga hydrogeniphila TaxID=2939460 RepID=UPI0022609A44|nr:acyl-protein synthetase [Parvivirga hydrogeniphila]MCL4079179.1 acyl-protein synthetase [Parvivirga hydrogeniphila]
MTDERQRLAGAVHAMIDAGVDGDPAAFEALALDVFAYQYEHNGPYRAFCDALGATPKSVGDWQEIPAYPTESFKRDIVTSFPLAEAVMANITSGTTSPNQRGQIFRDEIGRGLILKANAVMTGSYLFPDLERTGRLRLLLLTPGPDLAPTMGMAIGMDETRKRFGTDDSAFLVGRTGVDVKRTVRMLRQSETDGTPVTMVGATSAFVYFMHTCRRKRMRFCLPAGSRVCDGGGYRGRFGEVTREDFYDMVFETFGVERSWCINTLGMAESATNYFDDTLRNTVMGLSGERHKPAPPWTRVVAVDPAKGDPLPPGEMGLLCHYDLANLPTVIGVQTDNLGWTDERGGFEIAGRARVVSGRAELEPGDRPVGPMGDTGTFRLLEAYVNFSIAFKSMLISSSSPKADYLELRRELGDDDVTLSCPTVVEDLVAGAEDAGARARGEAALSAFQRIAAAEGDAAAPGSPRVPDE